MMLWARISEDRKRCQPLQEHLAAVRDHMQAICAKIGLGKTGAFIGQYHDMFKVWERWQRERLQKERGEEIPHGPPAALWFWRRYGARSAQASDAMRDLAALTIALVIDGHHGGLDDVVTPEGDRFIFDGRKTERDYPIFWENEQGERPELAQWERDFLEVCPRFAEIDDQFEQCVQEIARLSGQAEGCVAHIPFENGLPADEAMQGHRIALGLAVRYLSSALIDADRYDAWRFEMGLPLKRAPEADADWQLPLHTLEANLRGQAEKKSGQASGQIFRMRADISDAGRDYVLKLHQNEEVFGIRRLTLPTGAGKTFTSFRIALYQALLQKHERIFIVTPRLSILDQTGRDLRDVLGELGEWLFEHHSNVVMDEHSEKREELERFEVFTERWCTEKIVLTSMVHFLNALYQGSTRDIRRMQALANSVLIIDEVQDVPDSSLYLFNMAMEFLSKICGCSILLCSATQPTLDQVKLPISPMQGREVIPDYAEIYRAFRRVELDARAAGRGLTYSEVVEFALDQLQEDVNSLLLVANTKRGVRELAQRFRQEAPDALVYPLTTNACAAHRLAILGEIARQLGHRRLVCVSTSLIEYGVNLSFDCVIRLNCGLDHAVQAVGRCNRHGEVPRRTCYLLNCSEEKLDRLYAVQHGWESMQRLLASYGDADLMEPELLEIFYRLYFDRRKDQFGYPVNLGARQDTLVNLYGFHTIDDDGTHEQYHLRQAFRTAGRRYRVIEDEGTAVIVPYGREGEELASGLVACNACFGSGRSCAGCKNGLGEEAQPMALRERLRKAQRYSVNLHRRTFEQVGGEIAVYLQNIGAYLLRDRYYDKEAGLCLDGAGNPEEYIY